MVRGALALTVVWVRSQTTLTATDSAGGRVTVQEPGVVELRDGRLMMYCRSNGGSQYVSHSQDGGETWSPLGPSRIISPLSPASIKRIPQTGGRSVNGTIVQGPRSMRQWAYTGP